MEMFYLTTLILFAACLCGAHANADVSNTNSSDLVFKICVLLPITPGNNSKRGLEWEAITYAAESFINNQSAYNGYGYQLKAIIKDTLDNQPGTVTAALEVPKNNCIGVVDATTSSLSELAQLILQNYKIPQISALAVSTILSNINLYPTFLRTIPSHDASGPILASVIQQFGWKKISIITAMDSFSISYYHAFTEALNQTDVTIAITCYLDIMKPDYATQIKQLKDEYTAIIVVLAQVADTEQILLEAFKQSPPMLGEHSKYVWIGASSFINAQQRDLPTNALLGNLAVSPASVANTPLSKQYETDMARIKVHHQHGGFMYDALLTYAYLFQQYVQTNSTTWENPTIFLKDLKAQNFTGVSGEVAFSDSGDRMGYYYNVYNWNKTGVTLVARVAQDGTIEMISNISWADGTFYPNSIPKYYIIDLIDLSRTAKALCVILAIVLLIIEVLLMGIYLVMANDKQARESVKKLAVVVGNSMGFAAIIIFIKDGVTNEDCIIVPVLLDASFLLCGSALAFIAIEKYVVDYKYLVQQHVMHPKKLKVVLLIVWASLIGLNVIVLIGSYSSANRPFAVEYPLHKDLYELQCDFGMHFIALPFSVGLIYLFALCVKLLNSFIGSTVAHQK